jgi:CRISPR/Cas system CSM-associated protein Csm2 small subunit
MNADENKQLSMIERIERALVVLAYLIERDGDVYVPLYEKFEAELQELKAREDTKSRARRRLMTYSDAGALKAIC